MKVTLVMEELRHKYNLMDIEEDIRHIKADISSCRQERPVEKLFHMFCTWTGRRKILQRISRRPVKKLFFREMGRRRSHQRISRRRRREEVILQKDAA